jgi:hypothetical protein
MCLISNKNDLSPNNMIAINNSVYESDYNYIYIEKLEKLLGTDYIYREYMDIDSIKFEFIIFPDIKHYYPKNSMIENVSRRCWFTPWGWATWKDRFEEMESVWDFQGKNGSWDTTINHTVRKDRWELFPTVSRIQNIGGEMGTHVPNNEWHKQHHYNEYWIETNNNYGDNFEEI